MCFIRHKHAYTQGHIRAQAGSQLCPRRDSFEQTTHSGSALVALVFTITVLCSDDCEWRWACLFSCNCLFPTEISMSDPLIVLIIACLIFRLPEEAHHSASGTVGID